MPKRISKKGLRLTRKGKYSELIRIKKPRKKKGKGEGIWLLLPSDVRKSINDKAEAVGLSPAAYLRIVLNNLYAQGKLPTIGALPT